MACIASRTKSYHLECLKRIYTRFAESLTSKAFVSQQKLVSSDILALSDSNIVMIVLSSPYPVAGHSLGKNLSSCDESRQGSYIRQCYDEDRPFPPWFAHKNTKRKLTVSNSVRL
ncbi:hypothetical protein HRR83_006968 [Exophiala dermatitidis]|uniref:Uncharacterized protein n=1 Tax=Exophiala dermatitidis TaxID=5970 RepID=A0AAN6ETJ7_EXODE|nr:hypothetical protein HRR73_006007 [Exophiala dermatitidis]KAJ4512673.1 hypothetical protein HRR74_006371 [Exophiala dermatitidis]KAJ4542474.1 hypothetical protein HRR77_005675 [Exophiala dermatitidis]KAJ4548162.1 hypothetical protein HRR76_000773 [Exophiala dermatitidis]KAJ4570304.1 hypothetical protein HRR82_007508 [Exophiala dermatitidis]